MEAALEMWLTVGLITITVVGYLWYITQPFYWKKRNIPYLLPFPIVGNLLPALKYDPVTFYQQLNSKFPGEPFYGMHFLTAPTLYVKDPDLIHRILVTDSEHFMSHGFYSNQDRDPGGANVFHIEGEQWKEVRNKLNPYFTPSKVKAMLCAVDNTMPKLFETLDREIAAETKATEMYAPLRYATTDVITQAVFGIQSDAFENDASIFRQLAHTLFEKDFTARLFLSAASPTFYNILKCTFFPAALNKLVTDMVIKATEHRKKENVYKEDFLQGMMTLMENEVRNETKYFPDNTRVPRYDRNMVISQGVVLYIGGVETTALLMAYFLYEMALHPEMQQRCREEIKGALKGSKEVMLDHLLEMTYLNAAFEETLRLYSPFIQINRRCTKDYKVPDSDLTVEAGTFVLMSPISTHLDEKNFPDARIFRPERFLTEERGAIKTGTLFPFGMGPRICIGLNFALRETKLIVTRLLMRYEFHVSSKTQIPMKFAKYSFLATPDNGLWLEIKPLSNKENVISK